MKTITLLLLTILSSNLYSENLYLNVMKNKIVVCKDVDVELINFNRFIDEGKKAEDKKKEQVVTEPKEYVNPLQSIINSKKKETTPPPKKDYVNPLNAILGL